jgi:MoaA/NifB/PqqE/SkfB family radical SAM enzyme
VAVNGTSSRLPEVICFRVTRYCNARCGFCLAPPDGAHPDVSTLTSRIDWLLASGVRIFHFCGGEPTIHPALADLIEYVHRQGGKTRLTTNGILLPERVLAVLKLRRTSVKVSVHGDREYHDRMVGRVAFDQTSENLRRMVASRLDVSVQTTVVSGGEGVVAWMAAYCVKMGVRRLSILPFIPRGSGYGRRGEYELTDAERQSLRELVSRTRKAYSPRLEIRWLDFTTRPVPVMEADGRVLLEGATESLDRVIAEMPPALVVKVSTLAS